MTKDEAISWAVNFITASLRYEYFTKREHAEVAAQVMTSLSNSQWEIVIDNNGQNDRHWVMPSKAKSLT